MIRSLKVVHVHLKVDRLVGIIIFKNTEEKGNVKKYRATKLKRKERE